MVGGDGRLWVLPERLGSGFDVRSEHRPRLQLLHEHGLHDQPQGHEIVLHGVRARFLGEFLAV